MNKSHNLIARPAIVKPILLQTGQDRTELLAMRNGGFNEIQTASAGQVEILSDFDDQSIHCMDCSETFIWTAGEQRFFHDKRLQNPPKRCKDCKKAKNYRIAAVAKGQITGKKQHIEVKAQCANCEKISTVPFYPSQGRPVYCRGCFAEMNTRSNNNGNC